MIVTICLLLIIGFIAWFWYSGAAVKENAVIAAKALCEQSQWQLLDDTVTLKKISIGRDHHGKRCFYRHYQFDYALPSGERWQKRLIMCGKTPLHQTETDGNVIPFPTQHRRKP